MSEYEECPLSGMCNLNHTKLCNGIYEECLVYINVFKSIGVEK